MDRLSGVIKARREKLGETDAGAAWCLMALHPAAGPLKLQGIPDADSFPSVVMDYESVVTIPAPSTATGVWSAYLTVLPHPVQPVSFATASTGGQSGVGGVYNPTLSRGITQYSDMTVAFAKLCNSYRMLYCGVTVDLDASALNDAGSIVAGQFPIESQVVTYARPLSGSSIAYAHILNANYSSNFPGQSISQLPGAYMGLAKSGCYMPVKIDPCAPWVTTATATLATRANALTAVQPTWDTMRQFTLPSVTPTDGTCFPFYGSTYYGNPVPPTGAFVFNQDLTVNGDVFIPLQQTNMGHILFYNMNVAASLTIKVRWGVEMRVEPVSTLAPALMPSAMHDSLALTAYSDIAGSLPWAYPSEYNSGNKILEMIGKVWNTLKPIIGTGLMLVPHPAAQAAGAIVNSIPSFERPAGQSNAPQPPAPEPSGMARKPARRRKRKTKRIVVRRRN